MLTYALTKTGGVSLYEQLYRRVKDDILTGRLATGEKLPSKRALAAHLEVSVITVKNAYEQLMAEGYIYGMEKKGYYVSPVQRPLTAPAHRQEAAPPAEHVWEMDLVTNSIAAEDFPFTVWARLMRQTILEQGTGLLRPMPPQGAPELRRAIAAYLRQFRGMTVDEEQIIIGAGTEQLYNMLVQLLGRDKRYAVEDPGYGKIARIYRSNQARWCPCRWTARGCPYRRWTRPAPTWYTSRPATTIPPVSSCPSPGGRSCCAGRRRGTTALFWRTIMTASSALWGVPSPRCSPWTRRGGSST